jgi:cytochrome c peroxidase
MQKASSLFGALPNSVNNPDNPLNMEKVALGKMLFYDTRLSRSNTISCNSCHNLATYGVDNNITSIGHGWRRGPVNSPTVLNAATEIAQFWDGRARDVEEQAMGPVMNPIEMGGTGSDAHKIGVERISAIPEYVDLFKKAFPPDSNGVTLENIGRAIGAFERTLMTPSGFDKFMNGDPTALTSQEKQGLNDFINVGCVTCHNGPAAGGRMYQKFGLVNDPYWKYTKSDNRNEGRFNVTHDQNDRYVFKVPMLRNIAHTYPYFHDGSVWDLHEAVRIMSTTQLGKDVTDQQVNDIVAFLNSLTGEIKREWRTLPILPAAPPTAPKPDDKL